MNSKLYVSSSPHIHCNDSTSKIMLDVIISLIPAFIASAFIFGIRAIFLVLLTVASCVLSEYVSRKIMKRNNTISDLSAVVTGILLAFNLPVTINPLVAAFGGMIAIVVVKQMFGGIGQNFVNPAITARIILLASFPSMMSTWAVPFFYKTSSDIMTTATPLAKGTEVLKPSYEDMFFGNIPGCIGEVCSFALILGGLYLIFRKVISPLIPVIYIATVFVLALIFGQDPVFHILSGGLLLGAIFMATDYTTSPLTTSGKIIFGVGCGFITMMIRLFGALPEGVSFAIMIMNILVPHIENLTIPRTFGKEKIHNGKAQA